MTIEGESDQAAAVTYEEELVAPAEDVDELGHVSNLAYVRWIQEIAKAHSRHVGWDYAAYLRLGAVFVVRRHEIDYLAPVFAGERVRLVTWVSAFSAATSTRRTRVLRAGPDAAVREVARASTLWALVATEGGRPRRVPKELRAAFAGEALPEVARAT